MTCNKCGSGAMTPHAVWEPGTGHSDGYLLCGACGNVQPTAEKAAELRQDVREAKVEAAEEAEAEETADEAAELLVGNIEELTDRLAEVEDVALLTSALEVEAAGKDRAGALSAIQARIDELAEEEASTDG